jgi:hypothetical protein
MDDVSSLAFQRSGFVQDLKRRLGAESGHAAGKLQFVGGGSLHGRKTPENGKRHIIPPAKRLASELSTDRHRGWLASLTTDFMLWLRRDKAHEQWS